MSKIAYAAVVVVVAAATAFVYLNRQSYSWLPQSVPSVAPLLERATGMVETLVSHPLFRVAAPAVTVGGALLAKYHQSTKQAEAAIGDYQLKLGESQRLNLEAQAEVDKLETKNKVLEEQIREIMGGEDPAADLRVKLGKAEDEITRLRTEMTAGQRVLKSIQSPSNEVMIQRLRQQGYEVREVVT